MLTYAVEVRARGKEKTFDCPADGNLLTVALKNKVRIDHICRVGLCGTCQVIVVDGRESLSPPTDREHLLLDAQPLNDGVRLACQAKVQGPVKVSDTSESM